MPQFDQKDTEILKNLSTKIDRRSSYRSFFWLLLATGLMFLLVAGKSLLIPLFLAVFIWYLINVLSKVFEQLPLGKKIKVPYPLAFIAALFTIAGFVYFVVNLISSNIAELVNMAPVYQRNLEGVVERIFSTIPLDEPMTLRRLIRDVNLSSLAPVVAREITGFLGRGGIVIIYVLFLFLEQRSFTPKFLALVKNPKKQTEFKKLIQRIDADIRLYVGIKTLASMTTGVFSYLIFLMVGLDFASFWAFTIFLLNYIPTVGSIIATIFPSLLALMQFETLTPFFVLIIGVTSVQQFIGSFLEPRFMGDRLNLSPLVILLSLALWGRIWGAPGMLFCVPITSIAMIILSHFPQTKKVAIILSRNGIVEDDPDTEQQPENKENNEQEKLPTS
ncbi:putative transporter [Chitinispirillum alkaliphilum]|nr:putative transporter [Chitinispirillum alkaliphilum]